MSRRQLASLLALPVGVAAMFAGCDGGESPTRAIERPNIVVVMTDDQELSTYERGMPVTQGALGDRGTTFLESVVTTPLCCPSRAAFLTGQYGHNNGVLANNPGYPALGHAGNVLPVWLQRAGYRTGVIGKWLNGYTRDPSSRGGRDPAPGWDEWVTELSTHYYDYELTENGRVERFGSDPEDHLDHVITRHALGFLRSWAGSRRPFFLWLPYAAPHRDESMPAAGGECGNEGWAVPEERDLDRSLPVAPSASPAVDEADVSDKAPFVRSLPRLSAAAKARIRRAYGCELASLRSVDRAVGRIISTLRRLGELDRTLLIFTSDNGFAHGEHRLAAGKNLPYSAMTEVPLVIRPPTALSPPEGAMSDALVANIDIAPTILDYAGAEPCVSARSCRTLDGLSLRPVLEGDSGDWPGDRAIELQSRQYTTGICRWTALRDPGFLYAEFRPGTKARCGQPAVAEMYDLNQDPYELENIASDPAYADIRAELAERLGALKDCSGEECR